MFFIEYFGEFVLWDGLLKQHLHSFLCQFLYINMYMLNEIGTPGEGVYPDAHIHELAIFLILGSGMYQIILKLGELVSI